MGRSQRDEASEPAITDSTDEASNVTAINHCIDALEDAGVILRS